SEDGFRSPMILYNPLTVDGSPERLPSSCGAGPSLEGCRDDFAHAVDILATVKDFAETNVACSALPGVACGNVAGAACSTIPGGCSSEQTGACCADDASRADTKPPRPQCPGTNCRYRYQDGQSLRHADLRSCGDAAPSEFRQCLFGRQQNS